MKISSENLEGAADRGGQISSDDTVQLVIVIGQSGSGHSTALNILEDASFTAVDNLPLALVDQLVALSVETENTKLAIGVDLRTAGFDSEAVSAGQKFEISNARALSGGAHKSLNRRAVEALQNNTSAASTHAEQVESIEEAIEMDSLSLTAWHI